MRTIVLEETTHNPYKFLSKKPPAANTRRHHTTHLAPQRRDRRAQYPPHTQIINEPIMPSSPDSDIDFATAVQALWDLDTNRLTPNEDYKIDVQRSKHPCDKDDAADGKLFEYVRRDAVEGRPTYAAFRALLNNYAARTGVEEEVSRDELGEQDAFLDAIMETEPMKYLHRYCLVKNARYDGREVTDDESDFKDVLRRMWFDLYSRSGRGGAMDSSGFEHVFAGEVSESGGRSAR
jgi:poly(U)-specific endoribonuclease